MARRPPHGPEEEDTAPGSYPEIPPPSSQIHDHSFVLQAIMELHKSVGELSAKTDRLIRDVETQGKDIDRIRMQLRGVAGAIGIIIALLLFLPDSMREALIVRIFGG